MRWMMSFFLSWGALSFVSVGEARAPAEEARALIALIENHPRTIVVEGGRGGVPREISDTRDGRWRFVEGQGVVRTEAPETVARTRGDSHVLAFAKVDYLIVRNLHIRADASQEALKFSACRFVLVENVILEGGSEDALDIVRGENYVFRNVEFISRGDRAVTIKGGVNGAFFLGCRFAGRTSTGALVEFGNWSDYDVLERPRTRNVFFDAANVFEIQQTAVPSGAQCSSGNRVPQAAGIRTFHVDRPVVEVDIPLEITPRLAVDSYFQRQRTRLRDQVIERYGMEELQWGLTPGAP